MGLTEWSGLGGSRGLPLLCQVPVCGVHLFLWALVRGCGPPLAVSVVPWGNHQCLFTGVEGGQH